MLKVHSSQTLKEVKIQVLSLVLCKTDATKRSEDVDLRSLSHLLFSLRFHASECPCVK